MLFMLFLLFLLFLLFILFMQTFFFMVNFKNLILLFITSAGDGFDILFGFSFE